MSKHFYASARLSKCTPEVAFCFATKKERDAFVKRYNAGSTDSLLTAGAVPAEWVHKWRRFRRGVHFLYMVSGDLPRWKWVKELAPHFYSIGGGNWADGQPYPTYPYASTANQS